MKLILLLFVAFSLPVFAEVGDNFLELGDDQFMLENQEKDKWNIRLGAEYLSYKAMFPEFEGRHDSFSEGAISDITGMGLGVSYEIQWSERVSSHVGVNLIYGKTISEDIANASSDI